MYEGDDVEVVSTMNSIFAMVRNMQQHRHGDLIIYAGSFEYHAIRKSEPQNSKNKFMGYPVVQVARDRYLEVHDL